MENEGVAAADNAAGRGCHEFRQFLDTAQDGLLETRLLGRDDLADELLLALQFRVGLLHRVDYDVGKCGHEWLVDGEVLAAEVDGAAEHSAADVTALFVGVDDWSALVTDEEGDIAGMLGDDADGAISGFVRAVALAGDLLDLADQGLKEVGVVDGGQAVLVPVRCVVEED